ncbi:hypothetical protein GCM10011491_09850 [Brucella endophytica]|uniref:Lipoprotein n=1 Tax=Brucella endophytica TaxID=1963359 RepID=A0A916S4Z2_9HYPH|nr:hypothetical protein [Brucella endophytica]GGA84384.1 hypothetical protein GCM10011491_09850 [Brucella endophytica]
MARESIFMLLAVSFMLSGCMTVEEERAERLARDRDRCAEYGYAWNSPSFANCMMNLDNQRQWRKTARDIADAAAYGGGPSQDRVHDLAIQRSGDERYPICNAASEGAGLDIVAGGWYGKNCRMK